MRLAAAASTIHKWLGLIVGVQILIWIASGLFFTLYPIDVVRSEHRIAAHPAAPLDVGPLPAPALIGPPLLPEAPTRVTYERTSTGQAVAVAEFASRRPMLINLANLRVVSPLSESAASAIAQAYITDSPRVRERRLVTEESSQYRGPLPAWRIAFADAEGLAVYVVADTGRVSARRSDLWRLYDALWALHIMDWRDHENFNHGLTILAAITSLIVTLAGFVLLPYRLAPRRFTSRSSNQ